MYVIFIIAFHIFYFMSPFLIFFPNLNEILYFKDIANCTSKNDFWIAAWRWL